MSGWIKAGKAGWGAIKGVLPGTKIKGQSTVESIIKKGKKFKSKLADEAKKAQEAEFKKKPWKDPKKKWDQALREYVKK